MKLAPKLWLALGVLVLLSPLGLLLPHHFKAGSAWGEWSSAEIQKVLGHAPAGLTKGGEAWKAPLPGYAPAGAQQKGLAHLSGAYILSGSLGVAAVAAIAWLLGKGLAGKDKR